MTAIAGNTGTDQGLCERQLDRYLDMYRFGYELFVKAMFFYFAAVGAVGSYVFRADSSRSQQYWFLIIVICTSLAASVGCSITLKWWNSIAGAVDRSCSQLGVETIPIRGGKFLIINVIVDCYLIAGGCLAFLSTR
jgi:hypothetical protein